MCSSKVRLALVAACLLLAGAEAARPLRTLRQVVDSFTGANNPRPGMTYASTDYAEARSQAKTVGVVQLEAGVAGIAADKLPGSQSRAATQNTNLQGGSATEISVANFGPVAVSQTDTLVATAIAASDTMPLAKPYNTPGAARSSYLTTFDAQVEPSGLGNQKNVQTASIGAGGLQASNSFGISDVGDGPHAIASANEAVANSYAAAQAF
ncbi:hypothetical protein Rsub_11113 [Raphidocelis subcapitata]|uniref:Uncharacterized protein n=1 Tax=Raphidocelis subcapitata TaxID=307507 RepID=A0A2V0PG63_9CHLO|nr:hypothetical protein Rsub_11113 [Raphidocelis subcapitata]|eukprot:GBF98002.1 hypothetical protein Rsub_11113 [Raphidocelis subcapitata]